MPPTDGAPHLRGPCDELDENRPIPDIKDGSLLLLARNVRRTLAIEDAKARADSQPWGRVTWD